jgi:hypothetical protein
MSRAGSASAWRIVLPPLAVAKCLWFAVAAAVVAVDIHGTGFWSGLRGSLVHWDAIAFLDIAHNGYPDHVSDRDAFLPGFPLLVRAVATITRDDIAAAWLVTFAAEALALWYVARLVLGERDRRAAQVVVLLLALAPTALFLTAPFSEGPFIAAVAASLYYARRNRPAAAAISAAIACTFRVAGSALLPALALEQLAASHWRPRRGLLVLLLVPLPLLLYGVYLRLRTGDALAYVTAQGSPSFGEGFAAPWAGFADTWNTMITSVDGENRSIFAREVAFGLLGFVASLAMWASPRIPRSFAVYVSIAWLMSVSISFWRSEPRYVLSLFPALIVVSDVTSRLRRGQLALIGASALLMCVGTWVYAQGRWLG